MKIVHNLHFSVFANKEEFGFEPEFLADMFKSDLVEFLVTSEIEKEERISAKIDTVEPAPGFPETMYTVNIDLDRKSDKWFSFIISKMQDKDVLFFKDTIDTRIDDECNLYLRFDKKEFVENKKLLLVDHGNCIHLRAKVAAYPAKKDSAITVITEALS